MKTKQEVKVNIVHKIMELRNKGLIEEDSILDVLDDNLDPYKLEAETIIKLLLWDLRNKDYDCTKDIEKGKGFLKGTEE